MKPTSTAARGFAETQVRRDPTGGFIRGRSFRLAGVLCLTALLGATGCRVIQQTAAVPGRTVKALFPGGNSTQPDPGALQQGLMHFADAYSARTVESVEDLTDVPGSPFSPHIALRFKIASLGGAMSIATGQNPYASLLDMVSMVTLTRMILEDHWVTTTNGARYEPWLSRSRVLETNIWLLADQVLSPQQQDELRRSILKHYDSMAGLQPMMLPGPQELLVPRSLALKKTEGSVFTLAALDPMSGLDPAVREITETRLFAERAMYTVQRLSWLARWQAELLVLDATSQPQVAQALANTTHLSAGIDRISTAALSISQTAAALPAQVAEERKAIVQALEVQEGQIKTVLQSGTELSTSLNTTIGTFDGLMQRFGVGVPDTNPAPAAAEGPPFNILDYAKTADHITEMTKQLNVAIKELNSTLDSPALDKLSLQATADVRGMMNHAFRLGLVLIVVSGIVVGLVVLICRRLGR